MSQGCRWNSPNAMNGILCLTSWWRITRCGEGSRVGGIWGTSEAHSDGDGWWPGRREWPGEFEAWRAEERVWEGLVFAVYE